MLSIVALVAGALVITPATVAAELDGTITVAKSVQGEAGVPEYVPGARFSYELKVSCSTTQSDVCQEATITDAVPAPFVVTSVSLPGTPQSHFVDHTSGNDVAIEFVQQSQDGDIGLVSGASDLLILVEVEIPSDVTADFAGLISNTAKATALNAPDHQSSADVTLRVDANLAVAATKSATPGDTMPAAPGLPVEFSIGASNTSNHAVDSLSLTDPGAGSSNLEYLDFAGIGAITAPTGADTVLIEWLDADGAWTAIGAAVPIPADTSTLFDGIDLGGVKGTRFTFTSSAGKLPITAADGRAAIVLDYVTNDAVKTLPANTPLTVTNVVEATVTNEGDTVTEPASATVSVLNTPPSVTVAKDFAVTAIMPGDSTTATLRADNTGKPVTSMVITEPGTGGITLADQGLGFDGFVAEDIEWPAGAEAVAISYLHADGSSSDALTGTDRDTIPSAPSGSSVVGFTVTFTGSIDPGEYAVLPFGVTAQPISGLVDVTSTNTVEATVTDSDGQSASATSADDLTRQAKRVNTEISKNIIKGELWAAPGSSTLVSLPASVTPNDGSANSSTIGAQSLIVSDPSNPTLAPSQFWNTFDLQEITSIDVPPSAAMTPEYWDGTTWAPLPGVSPLPVPAGTANWSYTPSASLREQLQGIRFVFEPAVAGELLEPGFNVLPYFKVQLRDELRDGTGTTHDATDAVTIPNEARSTVANENAVIPEVTAVDDDGIVLKPLRPGIDPDLVDKTWIPEELIAQSDDSSWARLSWGTQDLPLDTVTITDPASAAELGTVATSVYDAFNVTRIAPMTDEWMTFDQLVAERYSDAADAWVPLGICTTADPCVGSFPGYSFTEAEQLDTIGVRFTFAERADRADVITNPLTDPAVGSGVAASGTSRLIDLEMQLRTELRSNASIPVLGTEHDYRYNSGEKGIVKNTVNATGVRGSDSYSTDDADLITILDRPLNVSLSKRFVDYDENIDDLALQPDVSAVGLPQAGTVQSRFPLVTALLTAENATETKVNALKISDPDPTVGVAETFYEDFNLYRIASITQPDGTATTTVTLKRAGLPDEVITSLVLAYSLTPAALSNVTGIVVEHDGRIASKATSTLRLEYQLREQSRSGDPVTTTSAPLVNTAIAELESPAATPGTPPTAIASDDMNVVTPDYALTSGKTISPATRTEISAQTGYTVELRGKPSGTVRTTHLQLDDATPTFWNAYDFAGFSAVSLMRPVEQLRVSVLLDTDFALAADGTLDVSCADDSTLDACWTSGSWVAPIGGSRTVTAGQLTNSFGTAFDNADVRGVRFEYRRAGDENWERPSNPTVTAGYKASRRTTLLVGADGGATTLIPTTRPGVAPAPGETQNGHTSNLLSAVATGAWNNTGSSIWTATSSAPAETVLTHLVNSISVTKVHGREDRVNPDTTFGTFLPGQPIPYVMDIVNTGAWPMTGLALSDQLTADAAGSLLVEPSQEPDEDPVSPYTFVLKNRWGTSLDSSGFRASLDPATGAITITVPTLFVFQPGDALKISAQLAIRVTPTVAPGTQVTNGVSASADRDFETCAYSANGSNRSPLSNVSSCASETTFTPAAASPLQVTKSVKGVDAGLDGRDDLGVLALKVATASCASPNAADGYYATPCVPITEPGGSERWRMRMKNAGNISATSLSSIDVLPSYKDQGVTVPGPRGSLWAPTFLGELQTELSGIADAAKAVVTTYYSSTIPNQACNAADIIASGGTALNPADPCAAEVADRAANLWQPYDNSLDAATLATVKALKFVVTFTDGGAVRPGESFGVNFLTQTAWFAQQAEAPAQGVDPIAWNVVSAASVGNDNGVLVQSSVTQPRRVGVAMATGQLDFAKLVQGTMASWSGPLPSDYPFQLQCTSGGHPVPLVGANGTTDLSRFSLKADGTVLHYNSGSGTYGNVTLPLNASCSIVEDPAALGVDVSYSADEVTALRHSFAANVANPAFTGTTEVETITATNTYLLAGFSVTKRVDASGAVDQDGTAIAYPGPYAFGASCTFLGTEILTETFSLDADGAKEFTELPTGAECTVTETARGGAASSSSVFSQTGEDPVETAGHTSTFTLTADDADDELTNELVMTNTFTVGAATITKEFAGNGSTDWGNEDFTVELSCTLAGAQPGTVFSDTQVLSKASPTWTISTLPSGAACDVTENSTGGANSSSVSPDSFIVGADTAAPTAVTVTNTFTTGSVRVTKALAGEPAASLTPATTGEYTVELSCTRDIAGTATPISIPGGAERVITGAGFAEYTGLPSGAECTVSETGLGHAQESTLDPSDGTVTIGVNDMVEVDVTNTFLNGSLEISKTVSGGGAPFAPASFDATLSCVWQGESVPLPNSGAITLRDGETVTIDELPLDTVCSIDEADAGQTSWTASPASVTVSDVSTAATIDVENVYELASLLVQKTVQTGEGAGTLPSRFAFSAQCTFQGAEVLPLTTFTLNDGESRTFDGLPARSECTVIETDARGADSTVSTVSVVDATVPPTIDQATSTVVIPELTAGTEPQNNVGFTNLFDSSALIVTKKLEGGAAQLGSDKSFDVALSCRLAGEDPWSSTLTLNAANGFSASLGELVAGTECTVTEEALNGADAVVITPNDGDDVTTGTVTIPDAGSTTVTVSNWFLSGSLEVTKSVLGDAAAAYGTADFGVALSCTLDGAPIEVAGGGARTVSAAQPQALFAGLPSGAECVLSETEDGGAGASRITAADGTTLADDAAAGYAFTVTTDPTVLAVEDQAQPALGLENVFSFAALTATKTVDSAVLGADGEPFDHGSFELSLQCTFNGAAVMAAEPMTRMVAASESISWTELPEGASCEVTETDSRGAIGTTVTVSQGELVAEPVLGRTVVLEPLLPGDAAANTVAFVNEFAAASVTLQKIVDGTAASTVSRTFPVALSCVLVDEQHPAPGIVVRDVTHQIGGPKRLTVTDDALPAGAECTVTETDTGDATRTSVSIGEQAVDGNTASFTLAAGGAAAATVTVTNTFTAPGTGLVVTGVEIGLAAGVGALILGLGGVLLLVARRRKRGVHAA
ncbi:hypothetical protein ASC66_05635 [Leifsonia sp. Root4]|nr:hypothetical protein ASC66_05635 [Leifsonia sp. Root4]